MRNVTVPNSIVARPNNTAVTRLYIFMKMLDDKGEGRVNRESFIYRTRENLLLSRNTIVEILNKGSESHWSIGKDGNIYYRSPSKVRLPEDYVKPKVLIPLTFSIDQILSTKSMMAHAWKQICQKVNGVKDTKHLVDKTNDFKLYSRTNLAALLGITKITSIRYEKYLNVKAYQNFLSIGTIGVSNKKNTCSYRHPEEPKYLYIKQDGIITLHRQCPNYYKFEKCYTRSAYKRLKRRCKFQIASAS